MVHQEAGPIVAVMLYWTSSLVLDFVMAEADPFTWRQDGLPGYLLSKVKKIEFINNSNLWFKSQNQIY